MYYSPIILRMSISTILRTLLLSLLLGLSLGGYSQLIGWTYKLPLVIKNEDGISRTNYVFKFTYNTQALVAAGNLDASGKDLRLAGDCSGSELLNFWIEKDFNTSTTVVWVFLNKLDSAESKIIYLFGKNPTATSVSNFNSTFVSRLVIDAANTQFQTIRDSVWKYNYIEIKAGVTSQFPSTTALGSPSKLRLDASKIVISGTLSSNGAGFSGALASNGNGPGGGFKAPVGGTAGGGGGHAGAGGKGAYNGTAVNTSGNGGISYGTLSALQVDPGSGGGASGVVGGVKAGANGGGAFTLVSEDIQVSGKISADGDNGLGGTLLAYCSGGGAGGGILFNTKDLNISGQLSVKGGNGGSAQNNGYPGGGAGGGYIKYFYQNNFTNTATSVISGGTAGTGSCCVPAENGVNGATYQQQLSTVKASISNYVPVTLSTSSPLPVCQGSTITITAAKGFTNYEFYVNNTLRSTGTQSFNSVVNSGDKIVAKLFTSPFCFLNSDTLKISTLLLPTITFNTPSETSLCVLDTFKLTASSPNASAYQWKYKGTDIPGENSASLFLTDSGSYTVVVTGSNGCTSQSGSIHFTYKEKPFATALNGEYYICDKDSLKATAASSLPGTFQWFYNGSPIVNQSVIQAKKAGIYYCEVTTADNCKAQTDPLIVVIDALPNPVIDTTINGGVICGTASAVRIYSNTGFQTYEWFRNGMSLNQTSDRVDAYSEGAYTVRVIGQNGCTNTSAPMVIKRFGPFESTSGPANTICSNDSLLIGNPAAAGNTISWTLNGATIPVTSATFYATQNGSYTFTVSNGSKCTVNSSLVVNFKTAPAGTLNTIKDTTFCENEIYLLTLTTNATTIAWYNTNNQVAGNVDKIMPFNSGQYYAVLTENGCTFSTPKVNVTVIPLPATPIFTLRFDSLVSFYPTGNQWLLNGNPIPGATGRVHHITQNGNYSLINIGPGGCQSDTSTVLNFSSTAILSANSIDFSAYPNPASTLLAISTLGEFNWTILDQSGRLLLTGTGSNESTINIADVADGVYILTVSTSSGTGSRRLVKIR